jgi:transglutaminase-like putative cysteine protease
MERERAAAVTVAPTLALAAVSAAVAAGFDRLVTGDDWLLLVLGAAVLPHAIGLATRTRSAPLQVGVWLAGLAACLVWAVVPSTTRSGLPTTDTVRTIGERLDAGLAILRDRTPPVPARPGVVLLMVLVVWIMACAADALAFRRWASVGALAPGVTVFIWAAALASGAGQSARAAAAVAVTAAAFLALQHQVLQTRRRAAVGSDAAVPAPRQVAGGVAIAVAAAALAVLVAPALPGAGADPLVDLRDDDRGSSTYQTKVPPLVDVAEKLRLGERVELFTVDAPAPQYWRTVALDQYSAAAGGQWTLRAEGGDIERGLDDPVPAGALRQRFTIGALGERWMPAAFTPVSVSRPDTLVVADSRTLVTREPSVAGLAYTVRSVVPAEPTAAQQRATGPVPDALVPDTELPAEVPAEVRALAAQVTAGATTPYDQARLLRDFFRDGSFVYDATVDLDDRTDATLEFLRTRRGFCVQFASTYALMARALGIPSRVAVGFTPGTLDPASGQYRVSNHEAHAWPEVWLPGLGWTNRFEPTPPSGEPGGSDLPGDTAGAVVAPPTTAPPPTTAVPSPGEPQPVTPETGGVAPTPAATDDSGSATVPVWALAGAALGVLVAGLLAAGPLAKARRRRRRRNRSDPAARVAGAWEDAIDRLRELGEPRPVHHTPAEVAARAERLVGDDAAASLTALAGHHTAAQFGGRAVSDADADRAWTALDAFHAALDRHLGVRARLRARLAPLRERSRV